MYAARLSWSNMSTWRRQLVSALAWAASSRVFVWPVMAAVPSSMSTETRARLLAHVATTNEYRLHKANEIHADCRALWKSCQKQVIALASACKAADSIKPAIWSMSWARRLTRTKRARNQAVQRCTRTTHENTSYRQPAYNNPLRLSVPI